MPGAIPAGFSTLTHPMHLLNPIFLNALRHLRRAAVALAAGLAALGLSTLACAQASLNFSVGTATTAVVQTAQVRAELIAHAPDGVGPGKTVWVGLQLSHQPQWHTYWKNPGDSGLPTQLDWELPAGVTASDILWPAPQKIAIGTLANFGYEGVVLLPVRLTLTPAFKAAAADSLPIKLHASWLVCKQECVPQEGQFLLQLPIKGSTGSHSADFSAAWSAAPVALEGPGTGARAVIEGRQLVLRISGLPADWRGKSLTAMPETPEIIETAHSPESRDPVASGEAQKVGTQAWSEGAEPTWSARLALSDLRSSAPGSLPWVLVSGGKSVRTVAMVEGVWPAPRDPELHSPQAAVSPTIPPVNADVKTSGSAWLLALASAVLGGLILNLMPCVFPVLAIKVLGFASGRGHHAHDHRLQGITYSAGVLLSFVALGGLMLALRASGEQLGWGFQLQSPSVIAALALLFTVIGLNLMGLIEIGNLLPTGLGGLHLRHPLADSFLSGVLAVAIASPCTAPFMGASLGYAITLPTLQALTIFAALGVGLALPYLLASWFPGVGQWLPKPGQWMETLRRFMAFPMWATVVWLVWVLGHLTGVDGAASLLALLLLVALTAWSAQQRGSIKWILVGVSVVSLTAVVWVTGGNVLKLEESSGAASSAGWDAWAPGRVEALLASDTPVFVDFTAAWCITCQYNKKTTLERADVLADFHTKKVKLLRADWTRRDPAITRALADLGRSGIPVYVLYQPGHTPVVFTEVLNTTELRGALTGLP